MKPYSAQAIASSTGVAEADMTPPGGYTWLVYQIGLTSNSSKQSTCSLYLNQRFMCGTNVGNQDAADGSPIIAKWSDVLRFVWSNCAVGAVCTVQLLVEEALVGTTQLQGGGYSH